VNDHFAAITFLRAKNSSAALPSGRLFLAELDRLAKSRQDFSFETTLSGRIYINRLKKWKRSGYQIEIIFLRLSSPLIALRRIAARVKQGGHNVPAKDVLRRFHRGWSNFERLYRPLADIWAVYDNSEVAPVLLERSQ
jgi:predicted ABC-type ATPase